MQYEDYLKTGNMFENLDTPEGKDYLEYKVVLLDEASMVNSTMFYQIIAKIKDDTIFIIVEMMVNFLLLVLEIY